MPTYQELVEKYQNRRRDTLMDSVAVGLSYADNVAVDLGLMEDSGALEAASVTAPFALIAVTEGMQVILGRKTGKAALGDSAQRMLKTGAAMGVGALAAVAAGGAAAAIPAAVGTRALLKHYQSSALLNLRLKNRIDRMRALREKREKAACPIPDVLLLDAECAAEKGR